MPLRYCKMCNMQFEGSNHMIYCENCRKIQNKVLRDKYKSKSKKIRQICIVCKKVFYNNQVRKTCSQDCRNVLRANTEIDENTKQKIIKALSKNWVLISPEGRLYVIFNLNKWAKENFNLFGYDEESGQTRIVSGVNAVKRRYLAGSNVDTYKGWRIVLSFGPQEIILLYKNGLSVNKIHLITGYSENKVRKILITEGLWSNDLSEKIKKYLENGKNEAEIAAALNASIKVVNNYAPYVKGVYSWKMSENATKIKQCREKKKRNGMN